MEQQIELLQLRKEHLENLIDLARGIKMIGVKKLSKVSFEAFDTRKIDEYAKEAKASWGKTDAWKEYEKKSEGRTDEKQKELNVEMMSIFAEFGEIKDEAADSKETQTLVKKLQDHITENYYTCTKPILGSLGMMYAGGGEMQENIDKVGGEGCAEFASKAIEIYCAE